MKKNKPSKKKYDTYIEYVTPEGEVKGIKLKTFKGINPKNSYNVGYVRHIAGTLNYIIGSAAYWSKRHNTPQKSVIVTDSTISKFVGCSESHASYLVAQIRDLFSMEFTRQKYQGGARTINLNKQLIDFLKIYNETDYAAYIETHNIKDPKLLYSLRQIYEYKIWEVVDSKLTTDQQNDKLEFIDQMRNYHHHVATSSVSNDARIKKVQDSIKYLTEMEIKQLKNVRDASKLGKLAHYLFSVLIKLEQKISGIIFNQKKNKIELESNQSQGIEGNSNQGATVAEDEATAAAQKIPEDIIVDPSFYIEVKDAWNNMIQDQSIPVLRGLTLRRIQSIDNIVKSYGKAKLLQAIYNVKNLHHDPEYKYKMQFERFIQVDTFVYVLEQDSFTSITEQSLLGMLLSATNN